MEVSLGPAITANVILTVAGEVTSTTVAADAPHIHADKGDSSITFNRQQISELPNPGNDLTYTAQGAPGVITNTDVQGYGNFSVFGMPGTSNQFTIDGVNNASWTTSAEDS